MHIRYLRFSVPQYPDLIRTPFPLIRPPRDPDSPGSRMTPFPLRWHHRASARGKPSHTPGQTQPERAATKRNIPRTAPQDSRGRVFPRLAAVSTVKRRQDSGQGTYLAAQAQQR